MRRFTHQVTIHYEIKSIVYTSILSQDKKNKVVYFYIAEPYALPVKTFDQLIFFIKQVPASHRSFIQDKFWVVPQATFNSLISIFDAYLGDFGPVRLVPHSDLDAYINLRTSKTPDPEEFFYSGTQPQVSNEMPADKIATQLIAYLDVTSTAEITRKAYLKASMKYHPDRNNGDGSKMAELNSLWQEYQKLQKLGA